jgi:hypothetical protein
MPSSPIISFRDYGYAENHFRRTFSGEFDAFGILMAAI